VVGHGLDAREREAVQEIERGARMASAMICALVIVDREGRWSLDFVFSHRRLSMVSIVQETGNTNHRSLHGEVKRGFQVKSSGIQTAIH
jgi:hypothetical protein